MLQNYIEKCHFLLMNCSSNIRGSNIERAVLVRKEAG